MMPELEHSSLVRKLNRKMNRKMNRIRCRSQSCT